MFVPLVPSSSEAAAAWSTILALAQIPLDCSPNMVLVMDRHEFDLKTIIKICFSSIRTRSGLASIVISIIRLFVIHQTRFRSIAEEACFWIVLLILPLADVLHCTCKGRTYHLFVFQSRLESSQVMSFQSSPDLDWSQGSYDVEDGRLDPIVITVLRKQAQNQLILCHLNQPACSLECPFGGNQPRNQLQQQNSANKTHSASQEKKSLASR